MKMNAWRKRNAGCIAVVVLLSLCILSLPSYADYIVAPDAYWPLNDNISPIDEVISSTNALGGICGQDLSGGCPSVSAGMVSSGLTFDSNTDEVYVVADPTGNAPFDWLADESFSIEFWMKRAGDNLTGNEVIISRDDAINQAGGGGLHLWAGITALGKATFVLRDINTGNDPNASQIISDTVVADGEWHHIVAMRDADSQQILLYVDGVSEPSTGPVDTEELGAILNPNRPLNIGYLNDHNGDRLHFGEDALAGGDLDEIALYSSALSADIIKQHYLNGQENKGLGQSFAPVITTTPPNAAAVGYTYSYDADAAGNPMPAYTLSAGPEGMILEDDQTGELSWVPFYTAAGLDHPFTVTATNSVSSFNQNETVSVYDLCDGYMDAYWDFNDSVNRYADALNDNDGGCSTNCPIVINPPNSIVGTAMQFNGANTWIDVPNDPVGTDVFDWSGDASFSIEFWLRRSDTISNNEVIVGRDDGDGNKAAGLQWWVGLNSSGQARFYLRDQFDKTKDIASDTVVADGQWHHVVAIRDRENQEVRLIVDGQPDPAEPLATLNTDFVIGFPAPLRPLNIGYLGTAGTGSNYFGGDLDEIALYNMALPEGISAQHHTYSTQIARGYCNAAPVITGPAFINGVEDTTLTIALNDLIVSDADNTYPLDHLLSIQAGTNYTVEGNTITPADDFNGALSVQVVVSDLYHDSNAFDLTVNVGAVNDPPVVDDIPDQEIMKGAVFQPIVLDSYVSDVDTDTDLLQWSYSGNTNLIVSIAARVATITVPNADWEGSETITFRATDPLNNVLYDEDSATFTVGTSAAPVVSGIPDQTIKAGGSFTVISLDAYVSDANTADDQLTWTFSGNTSLTVSIDAATRTASISTPNDTWTGTETITFRATDPNGNFGEDAANFKVEGSGGGGGGGGGCFVSTSRLDPANPLGGVTLVYLLGLIFILTAAAVVARKRSDG